MSYRDDRDALHARNQALEAEVAALRERQEQAARIHDAELEAALQGQRPIRMVLPDRHQRIHVGAAAAMIGASVLAFTAVMGARANRFGGACPQSLAPTVEATWDARVVRAEGAPLAPGDACTITAAMRFVRGRAIAEAPRVDCGTRAKLYDPVALDKLAQLSKPSLSVSQHVVKSTLALDLVYNESGEADRVLPHVAIDTARGVATVRRDDPALAVELAVSPNSRPLIRAR